MISQVEDELGIQYMNITMELQEHSFIIQNACLSSSSSGKKEAFAQSCMYSMITKSECRA